MQRQAPGIHVGRQACVSMKHAQTDMKCIFRLTYGGKQAVISMSMLAHIKIGISRHVQHSRRQASSSTHGQRLRLEHRGM